MISCAVAPRSAQIFEQSTRNSDAVDFLLTLVDCGGFFFFAVEDAHSQHTFSCDSAERVQREEEPGMRLHRPGRCLRGNAGGIMSGATKDGSREEILECGKLAFSSS